MNQADSFSRWSGSPLVKASERVLEQSSLPVDCREFLFRVGLPTNALWFDSSSTAIMCFDGIASLRELCETDVSTEAWNSIGSMLPLTIIGVYRSLFIVVDVQGRVFMICDGAGEANFPAEIPGTSFKTFVNSSVQLFFACLIAYKDLRDVFAQERFDFSVPAVRDAVDRFRRHLEVTDARAMSCEENYWAQILDDVDVW